MIQRLSDMTNTALLLRCGKVVTEYEGSKGVGHTNKSMPFNTPAKSPVFHQPGRSQMTSDEGDGDKTDFQVL